MSLQKSSSAAWERTEPGDALSIGSDSPVNKPKTHVAQARDPANPPERTGKRASFKNFDYSREKLAKPIGGEL
jgi:hypothetical protein